MLCNICHKNKATVHLTEIINDKVVELHICQVCAQLKTEELSEQMNMSDFLGGLAGGIDGHKEVYSLKCPSCGLLYGEFKKKGRLGCGECYSFFRKQLLPLLKKIHSSIRHVGKIPKAVDKKIVVKVTIKELKVSLSRAINLEEYEEAARLRDRIKELEEKEE
ncbi:MAG: UvrB/UvrC motif-containing protein [Candidatus Omnitrophica bacterium]|nr:UvrB/UvrC motif-containing protein [Candidatus Omnitrophota bacterium]